MLQSRSLKSTWRAFAIAIVGLAVAGIHISLAAPARAQRSANGQAAYRSYRGVTLGMTADEVRSKLHDPKDKSDEQDFFVFSETETAQIYYDEAKKVKAISIDYTGQAGSIPDSKTVLGVAADVKPDGSQYKLVRFEAAGFWVSYNRIPGDQPVTTVTIQKIGP